TPLGTLSSGLGLLSTRMISSGFRVWLASLSISRVRSPEFPKMGRITDIFGGGFGIIKKKPLTTGCLLLSLRRIAQTSQLLVTRPKVDTTNDVRHSPNMSEQ